MVDLSFLSEEARSVEVFFSGMTKYFSIRNVDYVF